ncbi:FkbM family methyltransferase [Dyella subtropica]|uniref:FkbM family methyltransferase n=1 Tax=Dyella subtropica TaxID=2992127 RepID=UPI00224C80C7|nr:FkbM family methyltransferase [Dyella subtropica]
MNNKTISTEQTSRLWNTRYGLTTVVPLDCPAARSLQLYGEWAEQEIDLLSGSVEDGHTVLEFGGDYGAHALWLAQAVGTRGQVHVAEPRRLAFQQMCANVAINGLTNVYTHARWLGRCRDQAPLSSLPGKVAQRNGDDETVSVITVDELELDALHLIKINVPGALIDLLAGAAETIRKHRPMLYIRLAGIQQAETEVQAIKDLGYRCWSHVPYLYNTDNYAEQASNIFPGCVSQNVIASPVESRFELETQHEL